MNDPSSIVDDMATVLVSAAMSCGPRSHGVVTGVLTTPCVALSLIPLVPRRICGPSIRRRRWLLGLAVNILSHSPG